ncbi:Flavodoxin [Lachnospiraceae bacterium TWA4]|nr:Flavodoxin [Lachnospiraceae bacterium TWA4]
MTCIEEAKVELKKAARPELKEYLDNVDAYDTIVVAAPCWWGDAPMAIYSQLDRLDLTGKTIAPLMTHEGSGLGSFEKSLSKKYPDAKIVKGLAVHGADAAKSEDTVSSWIKKIAK